MVHRRADAIYLARMLRKDELDAICREFSMSRYCLASSVIESQKADAKEQEAESADRSYPVSNS